MEVEVVEEGFEKVVEVLKENINEIEVAEAKEIEEATKAIKEKYSNILEKYKTALSQYVHVEYMEKEELAECDIPEEAIVDGENIDVAEDEIITHENSVSGANFTEVI